MIHPIILHHELSAEYTQMLTDRLHGVNYEIYDSSLNQTPFSVSFNNAMSIFMKKPDEYTHVMVLNNDISLNADQFMHLQNVVGSMDGIFSPSSNSPHPEVMAVYGQAKTRTVPWLEFICPIISRSVIESTGMLDDQMSLGWGIDIDYCYRASKNNMKCTLIQDCVIEHYEHKSQKSHRQYGLMAQLEMDTVLNEKYGQDWRKILKFKQ